MLKSRRSTPSARAAEAILNLWFRHAYSIICLIILRFFNSVFDVPLFAELPFVLPFTAARIVSGSPPLRSISRRRRWFSSQTRTCSSLSFAHGDGFGLRFGSGTLVFAFHFRKTASG